MVVDIQQMCISLGGTNDQDGTVVGRVDTGRLVKGVCDGRDQQLFEFGVGSRRQRPEQRRKEWLIRHLRPVLRPHTRAPRDQPGKVFGRRRAERRNNIIRDYKGVFLRPHTLVRIFISQAAISTPPAITRPEITIISATRLPIVISVSSSSPGSGSEPMVKRLTETRCPGVTRPPERIALYPAPAATVCAIFSRSPPAVNRPRSTRGFAASTTKRVRAMVSSAKSSSPTMIKGGRWGISSVISGI